MAASLLLDNFIPSICVCVSMTVEVGSQTQVLFCRNNLLNFWEKVFYWYLRIIDEARLAGQRTPGFYLSLPSQCWDYKNHNLLQLRLQANATILCFLYVYWGSNSGNCAYVTIT